MPREQSVRFYSVNAMFSLHCDHPAAGLLFRSLQMKRYGFLQRELPEDFQQTVRLFLLENGDVVDRKEFFRAVDREFGQLARDYGWHRWKRGNRAFAQRQISFSNDDLKIVFSEDPIGIDILDRVKLSLEVDDWNLLVQHLLGALPNPPKRRWNKIRHRMKLALGCSEKVTTYSIRELTRIGSGSKPNPKRPRVECSELRLRTPSEIMQATGCSRVTAWRIQKRGWYCPGYHQKSEGGK